MFLTPFKTELIKSGQVKLQLSRAIGVFADFPAQFPKKYSTPNN